MKTPRDITANDLIKALKSFGFENPVLYKHSNYYRIRLNTKDAYLLFNEIKDIVPPCMKYKLPEELRLNFNSYIFCNTFYKTILDRKDKGKLQEYQDPKNNKS